MRFVQPGLTTLFAVWMSASCCGPDSERADGESATTEVDAVTSPRTDAVPDSFDLAVSLLIERALEPTITMEALWGLEALGCRGVPAIVRRLDDRRPLSGGISLYNRSPDSFEAMRHYSPDQMVDALAAILNQITGQSFGFIYNGASDAARAETVRGWQQYVQRVGAEGVCPRRGA